MFSPSLNIFTGNVGRVKQIHILTMGKNVCIYDIYKKLNAFFCISPPTEGDGREFRVLSFIYGSLFTLRGFFFLFYNFHSKFHFYVE